MRGQQIELLELLKQAICIVIDPLGPKDRLSMVSFSGHATRLTPLGSCVTDSGKATAKLTVGYTFAGLGGNNIVEGLGVSPRCLTVARTKFVVASMILISDGQIVQAKGRRSKPCSAYVQAGRFLVLVYVPIINLPWEVSHPPCQGDMRLRRRRDRAGGPRRRTSRRYPEAI
jgi:hypothetical protein